LPAFAATCGVPDARAGEHGRSIEALATRRVERYPFAPGEAFAALAAFAEAERCYERDGDATGRARVRERVRAFRARVERDYRAHVTRYRLAGASGRDDASTDDERFLLDLLARDASPFSRWLRRAHTADAAAELEDP
jgi:hypothetical protein